MGYTRVDIGALACNDKSRRKIENFLNRRGEENV